VTEAAPQELEGRLHPLAVLVIARRFIGASLLPMLALIVSAGPRVVLPIAVVLLLVGVPLAVLSWWRFRYRVGDGKLELHSGVLSRSVRTIPLDRVRGIDVTEPFFHRLLGLVKVEVEAAAGGRTKAELSLAAVSRQEAELLREAVLAGPRRDAGEEAVEPRPLYQATPRLLVLGGLTSMRYLLAPAAVVGVVFNLADDLPGGIIDRAGEAAADRFPTDALGIVLVIALAVGLVLLAAIAGSVLVDWRFTVRDEGERLAASRGLLTRRVVHLDRDRIRGADVRDSPLRRPLRLSSVNAIAAGLRGRTGGTALAPVIGNDQVGELLRSVDAEAPDPAAELVAHPPASRRRRLTRALALPFLALILLLAFGVLWAVLAAAVVAGLALLVGLDRHRQLGHRFDGRRVALREGSLQRRWSELDPDAAVAFDVTSSPGQRRAGVCTLTLHLGQGAGSRRALDLGEDQATALLAQVRPQLFEPLLAPASGD
jgi:putative membrane protein